MWNAGSGYEYSIKYVHNMPPAQEHITHTHKEQSTPNNHDQNPRKLQLFFYDDHYVAIPVLCLTTMFYDPIPVEELHNCSESSSLVRTTL